MYTIKWILSVLLISNALGLINSQRISQNDVSDTTVAASPLNHYNYDAYNNRSKLSWMETAKNTLSGPAGRLVVHFAKEMISRSAGNSQVKFMIN